MTYLLSVGTVLIHPENLMPTPWHKSRNYKHKKRDDPESASVHGSVIRICIRIRDPDRYQNLIVFFIWSVANVPENFVQSVRKFLRKVAMRQSDSHTDRQTDRQTTTIT